MVIDAFFLLGKCDIYTFIPKCSVLLSATFYHRKCKVKNVNQPAHISVRLFSSCVYGERTRSQIDTISTSFPECRARDPTTLILS